MIRPLRLRLAAVAVASIVALAADPASAARSSYIQDGAQLFTNDTDAQLNSQIAAFNSQTHKEVLVVTVPSLNGQTPQAAAERVFAEQQVNGVMIFLAKSEKQLGIIPDRASSQWFPKTTTDSIRLAMRGYFRGGDFDGGIKTGVDLILGVYRSHAGSLGARTSLAPTGSSTNTGGFFSMSFFFLILILIVGFLVIRGIFRALMGPRTYPPGYGGGMGGPGYGPGYGGGFGGGGGFFSGLLGGLGGAWLGNELFGQHNQGGFDQSGIAGGGGGDTGGWQSDAGQADMGGSSFGDFGGGGGGGGDFGGGGDSGGW